MSMKPNLPSFIACAPMNLYRHLDAFMELIFYFWLKLPCDYNTMLVPSLASCISIGLLLSLDCSQLVILSCMFALFWNI